MRSSRLTCFIAGACILTAASTRAETTSHGPRWALAIHGGAGGSLAKLDEESRKGKKEGLAIALEMGRKVLADGGSALDCVETVVRALEDDPRFNAGRGAVVTTAGHVELDASIMSGDSQACGAVASVTRVKNPISLARRVMTETKHVLLVGKGAEEFAVTQNIPLVDPGYFLSAVDRPLRPLPTKEAPASTDSYYGTVGCVALDRHGNLAAGTSTGGTAKKLPGRVGDSPIVGAGTYASNDTCAVSGTGVGEEFIRHSVAYDIVAQMRYARRTIDEAVTEMLQKRLKPDVGGLIALSKTGEIVMQHNSPGMACGAADSTGRFETFLKFPE